MRYFIYLKINTLRFQSRVWLIHWGLNLGFNNNDATVIDNKIIIQIKLTSPNVKRRMILYLSALYFLSIWFSLSEFSLYGGGGN